MTIKNTLVATSLLFAMGAFSTAFAETKTEATDGAAEAMECITAAEVAAMTDEDKAKLTLPVCAAEEGATTTQ